MAKTTPQNTTITKNMAMSQAIKLKSSDILSWYCVSSEPIPTHMAKSADTSIISHALAKTLLMLSFTPISVTAPADMHGNCKYNKIFFYRLIKIMARKNEDS